jgi:predicted DCC family thiol-disulfide oxidoreductase YuxK
MKTQAVCTIYFDGQCPVCSNEIATYRQWRGSDQIQWIDASSCNEDTLGPQLSRTDALAKLHARDASGVLVSGATAFVLMWQQMPALRWVTPLLRQSWMIGCLDILYDLFLKLRPMWRK